MTKQNKPNPPQMRKFDDNNFPEEFKGFIDFERPNGRGVYKRHYKWNEGVKNCMNSLQELVDEGIIKKEEN